MIPLDILPRIRTTLGTSLDRRTKSSADDGDDSRTWIDIGGALNDFSLSIYPNDYWTRYTLNSNHTQKLYFLKVALRCCRHVYKRHGARTDDHLK